MIQYKPGDSWSTMFTTSDNTGAAVNADSTPTITVYRNGTTDNSNWSLSAVSNITTGIYRITGTVTTSASAGDLIEIKANATISSVNAVAIIERFRLVQWGVTSFPSAASGTSGAVLTAGTGVAQLSVSGGVGSANLTQVSGNSIPTTNTNGVPIVDVGYSNGVVVTNYDGIAQAGGTNTITLTSGSSSVDNIYASRTIRIVGGTGAEQPAIIVSYVGSTKVATVDRNWLTQPDNTSQYIINDTADVNLTQTVPTSNTSQTVGDAFNAARAQGFGKWVISGTTLTLYAADGSTVVRTFTTNSSASPTQRI